MKKLTPLFIKILIHLISYLETSHKLTIKPNYFLTRSFADYAKRSRAYNLAFYYLLRYNYLKKKLDKNIESFEITQKGKFKALKFILKDKPKQRWDGKWRLVFFDIPEKQFSLRNRLRENLQLLGFKYFQKSVWICPYDVRKEFGIIIDYLNIHSYIHLALIEKLEGDEDLKTKFTL